MSVKLRKRKRQGNKHSLYLDMYYNGKRKSEHLGLFIKNGDPNNKAILEIAERKRAERELELQYEDFGYPAIKRRKAALLSILRSLLMRDHQTDQVGVVH